MKSRTDRARVHPDSRCHAASALVDGCDEPVGEGLWSCHHHFARTYNRGQELIALAGERQGGAPASIGSNGRGRTPTVEKTEMSGGGS